MSNNDPKMRIERDSMGPMEVPSEAYYGASTMRAVLNFPISRLRFSRSFIHALALIKGTAAEVNVELGLLDKAIGDSLARAAQEVAEGKFDQHFVLDIFQTGSGTSTNMNANEVIANRASELMAGEPGSRKVHPNDHVNICQSSNDVIPTAIHLAALVQIKDSLIPALENLNNALSEKSREFWPLVKTGRTHLQDATPIRLGQEFKGYAGQVERGIRRLKHAQEELAEVALGGTAVGTGVNAPSRVCWSGYARHCPRPPGWRLGRRRTISKLRILSTPWWKSSAVLRTVAVSLTKIANDIRWLGSGPRAGLGELALPEVQPGSSIMPGKGQSRHRRVGNPGCGSCHGQRSGNLAVWPRKLL